MLGLVQPRAPAEHVGTVLSHLAFSQQVLHHHLRGSAGPERYARKELEILHGLRVGGAFVYEGMTRWGRSGCEQVVAGQLVRE